MSREFRVTAIAHGAGLARYTIKFTLSTNEIEMEKIWVRARREAKKRTGPGASIAIQSLEEVK